MKADHSKEIKRDCIRQTYACMIWSFFYQLFSTAAPMLAAWMMGDMANELLILNWPGISAALPLFLAAVVLQVFGQTLARYIRNIYLTKNGFDYDGFLIHKLIRLPVAASGSEEAGDVMARFEDDSADFVWNQMILCSFPGAIILSLAVFAAMMIITKTHILFVAAILVLALLPALRAAWTGKTQTRLKKEASEYKGRQKQLEQELYDARSLAVNFEIQPFFIERLRTLFKAFMDKTGVRQNRLDAANTVLDFWCSYGVQLGALLAGILLIAGKHMTVGALLSGYLIIPVIQEFAGYVKQWVSSFREEEKYMNRLEFFYAAPEETENTQETVTRLEAENIGFSYPDCEKTVLENCNFTMSEYQNIQLTGKNGSGKTTLMMLLSGLYTPLSGRISASAAALKKNTALQEQEGAVFSGTVLENLFVDPCRTQEAKALLSDMGFEKPIEYEVAPEGANLSPGERKKILLVRALMKKAPFLLLDEPLNHLDAKGMEALAKQLRRRKNGILLISHDPYLADKMAFEPYTMGER